MAVCEVVAQFNDINIDVVVARLSKYGHHVHFHVYQ